MIFLFKRITGLIALLIVEFILFIIFALFYTKALWTNWNSENSIYFLIIILIAFIITLILLFQNKKKLTDVEERIQFVDAKLLGKKQYGKMQRQLYVWTYMYSVNGKEKKARYWHVKPIRELAINYEFPLAIDPNNSDKNYFPFVPKNE